MCVWESCKWISESNFNDTMDDIIAVWESCKWISESNFRYADGLERGFESLVSE